MTIFMYCIKSSLEVCDFEFCQQAQQLCSVRHLDKNSAVYALFWFFVPPLCQVRQLQESAAQLRTVYAGEKAEAIACREHEVMLCWKELLTSCEECRLQITTETDKLRFFSMVRDQIMWMESIICQIGTGEKPRYIQKNYTKNPQQLEIYYYNKPDNKS